MPNTDTTHLPVTIVSRSCGPVQVTARWSNGIFAVTPLMFVGSDGAAAPTERWTLTHLPTGWACSGLCADEHDNPDTLARLAEHLMSVADWQTVNAQALGADAALRKRCKDAAQAFWDVEWASREQAKPEGGR